MVAMPSQHISQSPTLTAMKGRRKVNTDKWRLKSENEGSARELLRGRAQTQGRFLDLAAQAGKGMEPVGRLAG